MTGGEVLHYTLSRAEERGLFYSQPSRFKQIARAAGGAAEAETIAPLPRHAGWKTGRNKVCIKAAVSSSLRRSCAGYDASLPKATINSWLGHIQMFIFCLDAVVSEVRWRAAGGPSLAGLDSPHAARIKHKQVLNKETLLSGAATVVLRVLFLSPIGVSWPVFGSPEMPTGLLHQSLLSTL